MTTFEIRNFQGQRITEEVRQAVGEALYMGASHLLNEANSIAPIDEGPLTQTAGVAVDAEAGKANVYYVQKYAPRLHENPQFNFQRGREGKWLEKKLLSEGDAIAQIMANQIRERLGG